MSLYKNCVGSREKDLIRIVNGLAKYKKSFPLCERGVRTVEAFMFINAWNLHTPLTPQHYSDPGS